MNKSGEILNKRIHEAFAWMEQHRRRYLQAIETRTAGSHWGGTMPWKELAQLSWKLTKLQSRVQSTEYRVQSTSLGSAVNTISSIE
ncbi:hypothetical protein QUB24_09600 [Microcoleus sp. B9-D4]